MSNGNVFKRNIECGPFEEKVWVHSVKDVLHSHKTNNNLKTIWSPTLRSGTTTGTIRPELNNSNNMWSVGLADKRPHVTDLNNLKVFRMQEKAEAKSYKHFLLRSKHAWWNLLEIPLRSTKQHLLTELPAVPHQCVYSKHLSCLYFLVYHILILEFWH